MEREGAPKAAMGCTEPSLHARTGEQWLRAWALTLTGQAWVSFLIFATYSCVAQEMVAIMKPKPEGLGGVGKGLNEETMRSRGQRGRPSEGTQVGEA